MTGRVVGIDPAITETGLAEPDGQTHRLIITAGRAAHIDPTHALLRKIDMIRDWVSQWTDTASLIVMEEPYVDPKHLSNVRPLYFLQHALLRRFRQRQVPCLTIVPAQLKAYVGAKTKDDVHDAALTMGWAGPNHPDSRGRNSNESDAYVAYLIARHLEDGEPLGPPVDPKLAKYRSQLVRDLNQRLQKAAA